MKIKKILIIFLLSLSIFMISGCYAIYFSDTVTELTIKNESSKTVYINYYKSGNYDAILLPGDNCEKTYSSRNFSKDPYVSFRYCLDKGFHDENMDENGKCEKCGRFSEEVSRSYYFKQRYDAVIKEDGSINLKLKW